MTHEQAVKLAIRIEELTRDEIDASSALNDKTITPEGYLHIVRNTQISRAQALSEFFVGMSTS